MHLNAFIKEMFATPCVAERIISPNKAIIENIKINFIKPLFS
jgi:hypothetical protein